MTRWVPCPACDGTGMCPQDETKEVDEDELACERCHGAGQLMSVVWKDPGGIGGGS